MSELSEIGFMERDTTCTVAVGTLNPQMWQPKVQWPQGTWIAPPFRLHGSNPRNFLCLSSIWMSCLLSVGVLLFALNKTLPVYKILLRHQFPRSLKFWPNRSVVVGTRVLVSVPYAASRRRCEGSQPWNKVQCLTLTFFLAGWPPPTAVCSFFHPGKESN